MGRIRRDAWTEFAEMSRLRDGEHRERVHAHPRVIHLQLTVAAIDHVEDAVDGEGCLGYVGRDDHLPN